MNNFQKKMKDKIHQYSNEQYLDGYIHNEFLTDNGEAKIFLNVQEKSEIFDTWTIGHQIDLEKDVYEYIEDKTSMLGNDVPIQLIITGCEFTPKEQDIIKHVMKEHYAIELYKIQKEYAKYRNKIVFLILFGFFSLFFYAFLYVFTNYKFFMAVFSFLFSFSLWEAMDSIIYTLSDVKYEREAITQNLLMDVEFEIKE